MTNISKLLTLCLISCIMFSCSKDEGEDNKPPYIEQGVMKIDKVKATSVVVSFSEGTPDNIKFQIRKKGDQEFVAVDDLQIEFYGEEHTILGLVPLEEYELTMNPVLGRPTPVNLEDI